MEVRFANKLDFWGVKEAIMIFADKPRIFNGLLGKLANVCLGADDADVIGFGRMLLVSESNVLADEHPYPDAGHVEAIQEILYVRVDLHPLALPLVLEDALS